MCSRCAAVTRLFRSDSRPVSRGGRPNSSRNGLVMLPSGRAIERCPSGRNVYGSGIALEYFSACRSPGRWRRSRPRPPGGGADKTRSSPRPRACCHRLRVAGQGRKLIGLRIQNQAIDVLEVVVRSDQFTLQVGQQLGVAGRVVGANVVGLVNNAAAIEPVPEAIDDVAGEPGILGVDQPIGEHLAGIAVGRNVGRRPSVDGARVGKDRRTRAPRRCCRQVWRASDSDRRRRSPLSTRRSICSPPSRRRPTCRPGDRSAISPPARPSAPRPRTGRSPRAAGSGWHDRS